MLFTSQEQQLEAQKTRGISLFGTGQIVLAMFTAFSLNGCFIRLPYAGTAADRKYLGKTATTRQAIDVYTLLDGKVAIDPARAKQDVGDAQRKVASLPKGTLVSVRGMIRRITPWNTPPAFVCRAPQQRVTFDVYGDDTYRFLDWTSEPAATGVSAPAKSGR
jgi:hypothetical protein